MRKLYLPPEEYSVHNRRACDVRDIHGKIFAGVTEQVSGEFFWSYHGERESSGTCQDYETALLNVKVRLQVEGYTEADPKLTLMR